MVDMIETPENAVASWNDYGLVLDPHQPSLAHALRHDLVANAVQLEPQFDFSNSHITPVEGIDGILFDMHSDFDRYDGMLGLEAAPWGEGSDLSFDFGLRSEYPGWVEVLQMSLEPLSAMAGSAQESWC